MLGESLVQPHGHFWAKPMTYWYWKDVIPVPSRQGVAGRLLFFFVATGKQHSPGLQRKACKYLVLSL